MIIFYSDKDRQKNKVQVDESLIEVVSEPVVIPANPADGEAMVIPAEPVDGEAVALKSDKSDDEILEAVIKTATTPSGRTPRDNRRRSRNGPRKSCMSIQSIYSVKLKMFACFVYISTHLVLLVTV